MGKCPVSDCGSELDRNNALCDAKQVIWEWGMEIAYYQRSETLIQRDKYNSRKRKTIVDPATIVMRAYPIVYAPRDDDLKKAGLREKVDVLIYTAMQDWIDNSIDPDSDIDSTRDTFSLTNMFNRRTYQIKEIGLVNQFVDTFLNVSFGLVLR
jgi:hypothetical protein